MWPKRDEEWAKGGIQEANRRESIEIEGVVFISNDVKKIKIANHFDGSCFEMAMEEKDGLH